MRVLEWILQRVENKSQGVEHVFGISPGYEDIHWGKTSITPEEFALVTSMDPLAWQEELALHDTLFEQFNHRLPKSLIDTKTTLEKRLMAWRQAH